MSEKICGIYKIENKKTHQVYIGQSNNIERRWREHAKIAKRGGKELLYSRLYKSMYKHLDDFNFSIIEECSKSDLDEKEIYWISYYDSTVPYKGYNVLSGGQFGVCDNPRAVLNDDTVRSIVYDLRETSDNYKTIGLKYGVTYGTIYDINVGNTHAISNESYPIRKVKSNLSKKKRIENSLVDSIKLDGLWDYCTKRCSFECDNRKIKKETFDHSIRQNKIRRSKKRTYPKHACPICGKVTTNKRYCSFNCRYLGARKTQRPTKDALEKLITSTPFTTIGKMYGVTDKAIERWCVSYGLPSKSRMIKESLDKEILQYDLDGNFVNKFQSRHQAALWCCETFLKNKKPYEVSSAISNVANGKRKTAYGYIWKFA